MASIISVTLISVVLLSASTMGTKNMALETNDVSDHFLSTSINFIFDLFLRHYTSKLVEEGRTKIQVEDFERRFSTKILSMNIEGAIEVSDGWCSNISTVHRTGDADMERVDEYIVLITQLGLGDLKIDYNSYDVSILGAHQKGKIHVTVGANSLWLKMKVQLRPSCAISLDELKIEKLDDIEVEITHLGIFENLTDEITSWVLNEATKSYRTYIENTMYPELSKAVKDADLCHYLPI